MTTTELKEIRERARALRAQAVEDVGASLVKILADLSPDERKVVFEYLGGSYCLLCGRDSPRCHCWNDE
jgi:uncharacterized membrane protein